MAKDCATLGFDGVSMGAFVGATLGPGITWNLGQAVTLELLVTITIKRDRWWDRLLACVGLLYLLVDGRVRALGLPRSLHPFGLG